MEDFKEFDIYELREELNETIHLWMGVAVLLSRAAAEDGGLEAATTQYDTLGLDGCRAAAIGAELQRRQGRKAPLHCYFQEVAVKYQQLTEVELNLD